MTLNITTIQARDIPDAWFQCVYEIIDKGHRYQIDRGSFQGQERLEFDYITVQIKVSGNQAPDSRYSGSAVYSESGCGRLY